MKNFQQYFDHSVSLKQLFTKLPGVAATEQATALKFAGRKFAAKSQFQKIQDKISAMTDRELWCFVSKFRQLLSAGKTAKLVMDS